MRLGARLRARYAFFNGCRQFCGLVGLLREERPEKKKKHRPSFVLGNDEARFSDSPSPLRNACLLYSLFFSRSHSSCYLRVQITYTESLCFFFSFRSCANHHSERTILSRHQFVTVGTSTKATSFFFPFCSLLLLLFFIVYSPVRRFSCGFFFCGEKKKKEISPAERK